MPVFAYLSAIGRPCTQIPTVWTRLVSTIHARLLIDYLLMSDESACTCTEPSLVEQSCSNVWLTDQQSCVGRGESLYLFPTLAAPRALHPWPVPVVDLFPGDSRYPEPSS